MKLLQGLALAGLICLGTMGLSATASAAPLANAPTLGVAADTGSLVVEVRNGRNGALAAGAVLGVLAGAAIVSAQHDDDYYYRHHRHHHYVDDDDDYNYRVHCRYGSYVDYSGVRHCRP